MLNAVMPLLALSLYLLLYFSHCSDSIFLDVDFVWFNPLPALTYQTVLDLNAACRSKRTETYWLFSSQLYCVLRTK